MKYNALTGAVVLTLFLSACGDENSSASEQPNQKPDNPFNKYLMVDVDHQPLSVRKQSVAIGRYNDEIKVWSRDVAHDEFGNIIDSFDKDGDGQITVWDAEADGIINPDLDYKVVNSDDVVEFLANNPDGLGQYSARPDVFVEGQYSIFDLLRYMVYNDDGLKFESVIPYSESKYKTTEFVLSQDVNGDGAFDSDDGEYFSSPNWHFRFKTSGGDFMRAIGEPNGEASYLRMDEMWAQNDMSIRFQPFHDVFTSRLHYLWEKEVNRLDANGGKYILESLDVTPSDGQSYTYIKNLEVTAHNLRSDVFKSGVITGIDLFMSAIDEGYDIKLSYWPVLDTGASVNSYSVNHVAGETSSVGKGWMMMIGEKEIFSDYGNSLKSLPKCNWDKSGASSTDSAYSRSDCLQDYQFGFGANVLHLMTDVYVMNNPKQFAQVVWGSHYPQWGMEEYNGDQGSKEYDFGNGDTARLETLGKESNPDSSTLLTETHYGWGKANCMLCHDSASGHKNGAPLPVNSVDGFDEPQSYFCATCHGGNGAPSGHGANSRCFWCHSRSNTPDFHGDAFEKRSVPSILDKLHTNAKGETSNDPYFNHESGTHTMSRDKSGNAASYPGEGVLSGTNSDWSMSKDFPDPYSCMTCHSVN
ncbi:hypothetical protein [Ferrimonas kyonanensis]|uniref:hypothetical protein n=1 Tax=Ferrimonas kyonanensis TaxID=364763 RepID=UPI00041F7542|nr:hypothetical protein [Ferrimonas kyonanensis]